MTSSKLQNRKILDKTRCPLCGGPNECALAADPDAAACWCDSLTFPRELLAQIPGEAVRKACVCQTCYQQFQESSRLSGEA